MTTPLQLALFLMPGALPPWWVLHGVKPDGPDISQGSYTTVSFSKDQQDRFGVDGNGQIVAAETHAAAIAALKTQMQAGKEEAAGSKAEWPELVGKPGTFAEDHIRKARPDLTSIDVLSEGAFVTMDFRTDRVRVWVSPEGLVARTPRIG